jgi:hypothetical protein
VEQLDILVPRAIGHALRCSSRAAPHAGLHPQPVPGRYARAWRCGQAHHSDVARAGLARWRRGLAHDGLLWLRLSGSLDRFGGKNTLMLALKFAGDATEIHHHGRFVEH